MSSDAVEFELRYDGWHDGPPIEVYTCSRCGAGIVEASCSDFARNLHGAWHASQEAAVSRDLAGGKDVLRQLIALGSMRRHLRDV